MPRRIPNSIRKKRANQLLKRAIKRGDIEPEDVPKKTPRKKTRKQNLPSDTAAVVSARKLQSAFVKLPPDFLKTTRQLAFDLPLSRPIPDEKAIYHGFEREDEATDALTCPKRPKWRFDMTKTEVERNEEGVFKKYLSQTDDVLEKWQSGTDEPDPLGPVTMPRSPSYFERNLEVWRQLWRVTEISQIILVLLDSRCPIVHYPPSLSNYLADRKVILVLTKVDIAGPARVQAWINYINNRYPNSRIVQVESYVEKATTADHQGRKQYQPHIPEHFRATLINEIKQVHAELLQPPERVASNPDRLKSWVPPVKREVDWDGLLNAKGDNVGLAVGGATVPRPQSPEEQDGQHGQRHEPTQLTIGLIGQPNVGKSSLLNALFGASRVRTSSTPGKTKHFQTLYWTHDVRLVDCPGLVMPNFVPMEMQVLCGILPISRVSAVPSCIHFATELLPLERILNLTYPTAAPPPAAEDKRTWRGDRKPKDQDRPNDSEPPKWTAMDILTAYAIRKGWMTAKAGRPDTHRAGNALLRALAEGKIGWAFWPPDTPLEQIAAAGGDGHGLWIPRADSTDEEEFGSEEDADDKAFNSNSEETEEEDDDSEITEEEEVGEGGDVGSVGVGMFGALAIEEEDDDEEEEESEK
ncbi:P-loop containing nucleoside triphosphate hydrolase protein [Agrocybe pediades]|nr:P-loop containing nucleoside triphosphate hydrolase protein [Agrocybe pediades]